jgi:hypothetical protein
VSDEGKEQVMYVIRTRLRIVLLNLIPMLLLVTGITRVHGQTPGSQSGSPAAQLFDPRRDYGQSIAPVYEGWEANPDGSVSMYFGYMNRNWKEEPDVPIGPGNSFSPAPPDRGQPTHFLTRRQKQLFSIQVPKDFKGTVTWTLTVHDVTEKVPGSLKPEQAIDVHKDTQNGNTPPKVDAGGPRIASAGQPLALNISVTDDGLPKGRGRAASNPKAQLHVEWSKYRGPGTVKFTETSTPVKDGKAVTTATFSAPGEYQVQALADDGSVFLTSQGQHVPGFACCWSPVRIPVSVK